MASRLLAAGELLLLGLVLASNLLVAGNTSSLGGLLAVHGLVLRVYALIFLVHVVVTTSFGAFLYRSGTVPGVVADFAVVTSVGGVVEGHGLGRFGHGQAVSRGIGSVQYRQGGEANESGAHDTYGKEFLHYFWSSSIG